MIIPNILRRQRAVSAHNSSGTPRQSFLAGSSEGRSRAVLPSPRQQHPSQAGRGCYTLGILRGHPGDPIWAPWGSHMGTLDILHRASLVR